MGDDDLGDLCYFLGKEVGRYGGLKVWRYGGMKVWRENMGLGGGRALLSVGCEGGEDGWEKILQIAASVFGFDFGFDCDCTSANVQPAIDTQ